MRPTVVAVALAVAVTASTGSTAVAAFAQPSFAAAHATTGKPVKPSKPARPKKFAVSGSITVVADGAITVAAKGGAVTVTVPSGARIIVNGAPKSLDDVATGYRVTVVGVRTGSVWTAVRIQARGGKVRHTPSVTPTPEPSESGSPEDD